MAIKIHIELMDCTTSEVIDKMTKIWTYQQLFCSLVELTYAFLLSGRDSLLKFTL